MKKIVKNSLRVVLAIFLVVVLLVVGYVSYVVFSYKRIKDNLELTVENGTYTESVTVGKEYTIVTQNVGFGAYTQDFSFFMDGGKESWAKSKESVITCINEAGKTTKNCNPDFVLFQEVDTDSTRSYHVDQTEILKQYYKDFSSVFAVNYNSAFLMYPFNQPHGSSKSGIMTFSKYKINSSLRRSLPISNGFPKFLDLDRGYSVSRISVDNGKELVIFNTHMSAYGGSDKIRKAQMTMLFNDMNAEYLKGNYCVCGGDFNHDFTGTSVEDINGYKVEGLGWAQPFPTNFLPESVYRCINYTEENVPTCRNCDVEYKKGNFTLIVDGFLATENVESVSVTNIMKDFTYSDHNPVVMTFKLK